jgi:hypothetical protein
MCILVAEIYSEQPVIIKGNIPNTLKLQFKVLCTQRELNMSLVLERLIRQWIQADIPNPELTTYLSDDTFKEIKGYIPKTLKSQFKILCIQKQVGMSAVLHYLIQEWVRAGGPVG